MAENVGSGGVDCDSRHWRKDSYNELGWGLGKTRRNEEDN